MTAESYVGLAKRKRSHQRSELKHQCLDNGGELPLPLWERVGVRGHGLSIDRNPSPGSHPRCDPTSPTRGEVNRARGTDDSKFMNRVPLSGRCFERMCQP